MVLTAVKRQGLGSRVESLLPQTVRYFFSPIEGHVGPSAYGFSHIRLQTNDNVSLEVVQCDLKTFSVGVEKLDVCVIDRFPVQQIVSPT